MRMVYQLLLIKTQRLVTLFYSSNGIKQNAQSCKQNKEEITAELEIGDSQRPCSHIAVFAFDKVDVPFLGERATLGEKGRNPETERHVDQPDPLEEN